MSYFISDCSQIFKYNGSQNLDRVSGVFKNEIDACGLDCTGLISPKDNYYLGGYCNTSNSNSAFNIGYRSDCSNVYATLHKGSKDYSTVNEACRNCNKTNRLSNALNYNLIGSCSSATPITLKYASDGYAWYFTPDSQSKSDKDTAFIACQTPKITAFNQLENLIQNYGSKWNWIGNCQNLEAESYEHFQLPKNDSSLYLFAVLLILLLVVLFFCWFKS